MSVPRFIAPTLLAIATLAAEDAAPVQLAPAPAQTSAPAAGSPASATDTITVTGAGGDAFTVGRDGSASKFGLPPQQDPQSSTVLGRDLLDARAAYSLRDALRSAPGVTMAAGEGGRTGDSLNIRGFSANSDIYLDGLKDNGQYFRDTFDYDRVEVLRGASGVLFGRGSTGGAVNAITRKPTESWTGDAAATIGDFNFTRVTAGAGGPLVDDRVGIRLDALSQDGGSFRDHQHLTRTGGSASLAITATPDTTILLQARRQHEESTMDYGVPMWMGRPADVPVETYYGFADDSFQRFTATQFTATIEHKLDDHVTVRNATRFGDYYRLYRTEILGNVNYTTGMVALSQALRDNLQTDLINQSEVHLQGPLAGHDASLLLGMELSREYYRFRSKSSTGVPTISVFDPQQPDTVGAGRADSLDGVALDSTNNTRAVDVAGYALGTVDLTRKLKLVLGARFERFSADYVSGPTALAPTATGFSRGDTMFSPRAGLVWTPVPSTSLYASYSTAFNPSAETFSLNTSTADLEPEKTRNIEVGAKTGWLDQRLTAEIALFRLEKTNARTTDPTNTTLQVLDGVQRTDGIEVQVSGDVTRRWRVQAGAALYDAEVVRSNNVGSDNFGHSNVPIEGMRPTNTPRSMATLWTSYDLGGGLSLGGGLYAISEVYTNTINTVSIPGYVRADASLAWRGKRNDLGLHAQLNVTNLFNKQYYEAGSTNFAYPGAPLAATLNVGADF